MRNILLSILVGLSMLVGIKVEAAYHFSGYQARPPIHVYGSVSDVPTGISPAAIKAIYHLPETGGRGIIAIVGAYSDPSIERNLNVFSHAFNLPECTTVNGCFKTHLMSSKMKSDNGWAMEGTLDVEWAHAIAPSARILLVEANTPSGPNLLKAVDYAVRQPGVVAVSMSWGGAEFPEEAELDKHFKASGIAFFASSGDNGWGASWPAASSYVVAVGGSSLNFKNDGTLLREQAWEGSGGGVSAYEKQPQYQASYNIAKSKGMRAIPDVSYDADPKSGFSIFRATGSKGKGWYTVGGTSAGAPQWAAIQALGHSAFNRNFYNDKASSQNAQFFRDVVSGSNGECGYYCDARHRYDYVTGLGSPITVNF